MYFAVVKITFEDDGGTSADPHAWRSLCEKLRSRFKVCAAVCSEQSGTNSLAVTALGSSEERLSHTLDQLVAFCENAGLGRVASEDTLMDHIDNIAEFTNVSSGDDEF